MKYLDTTNHHDRRAIVPRNDTLISSPRIVKAAPDRFSARSVKFRVGQSRIFRAYSQFDRTICASPERGGWWLTGTFLGLRHDQPRPLIVTKVPDLSWAGSSDGALISPLKD